LKWLGSSTPEREVSDDKITLADEKASKETGGRNIHVGGNIAQLMVRMS
jgi:hypothetical protein